VKQETLTSNYICEQDNEENNLCSSGHLPRLFITLEGCLVLPNDIQRMIVSELTMFLHFTLYNYPTLNNKIIQPPSNIKV
jgi:hypothetical protein